MIRRTILLFAAVTTIFIGSAFILRQFKAPIFSSIQRQTPSLKQFELLTDEEESKQITREVLLSSPLIIFDHGSATPFTPLAVIEETNRQRSLAGLVPLKENSALDSAAELKVQDMFENQYFEHVSPTGVGPDSLAQKVTYEYVSIGENLALGTFGDEGALVDAWMKSPGHRANILRAQFQEIGLAVGRGNYNGRQVLIAVQEFGRPLTSCPTVGVNLKHNIDIQKNQLATLGKTLEVIRGDINVMSASSTSDEQVYQNKINLYNSEVTDYNTLVASIKSKTTEYNTEVRAFNACLKTSI